MEIKNKKKYGFHPFLGVRRMSPAYSSRIEHLCPTFTHPWLGEQITSKPSSPPEIFHQRLRATYIMLGRCWGCCSVIAAQVISQLFVYKTRLWTQLCTRSRYINVRPLYAFVVISRSFQTVGFFFQASCLFTKSHKCKQKNHKAFSYPLYLHYQELWGAENFFGNRKLQKT